MLEMIENFILSARHNERVGFDVLYETLIQPEHHIGLRKGLIPIYLAVVLHEYKRQLLNGFSILDIYFALTAKGKEDVRR